VELWGYMKQLVYATEIPTIEVLRERIENAAITIRNNRAMLGRVKNGFEGRVRLCLRNNGGHFDVFSC
jgi:hypothetical protein